MAEVLTKTAIKDELRRRIAWFEEAYGFEDETTEAETSITIRVKLGRYKALKEMLWQVEHNLFLDGFAC